MMKLTGDLMWVKQFGELGLWWSCLIAENTEAAVHGVEILANDTTNTTNVWLLHLFLFHSLPNQSRKHTFRFEVSSHALSTFRVGWLKCCLSHCSFIYFFIWFYPKSWKIQKNSRKTQFIQMTDDGTNQGKKTRLTTIILYNTNNNKTED